MDFFKNATDKANEVLSNVSLFLQKDDEDDEVVVKDKNSKPEKENKSENTIGKEKNTMSKYEPIISEAKPEKAKNPGGKKTFIADGVIIDGNITVDGDIEISGNLNGDLKATGKVILRSDMTGNISAGSLELNGCKLHGCVNVNDAVLVSKESLLEGNAKAAELNCAGKILGNVDISGKACFVSGSAIDGDVITATLSIEENARINGAIKMSGTK